MAKSPEVGKSEKTGSGKRQKAGRFKVRGVRHNTQVRSRNEPRQEHSAVPSSASWRS